MKHWLLWIVYMTIKKQILKNDTNFNKSSIKFEDRYKKMNVSQNSSSLSCYGKTYLDSRRGKIKMQPTSVSRRTLKNGSRQKQHTSRKRKLELPNRRVTLKREHNFAKIVKCNKPSTKKLGSTMSSITTYPNRKVNILSTVAVKADKETDE